MGSKPLEGFVGLVGTLDHPSVLIQRGVRTPTNDSNFTFQRC